MKRERKKKTKEEPVLGGGVPVNLGETEVEDKPLIVEEEPIVVEDEEKPSDMVKVKVLVGSLRWEDGTFQKGDVFETTKKRAAQFDSKDVKVV